MWGIELTQPKQNRVERRYLAEPLIRLGRLRAILAASVFRRRFAAEDAF